METSLGDLVEFGSSLTVVGLLLVIFWGGLTRKWVFGWVHEEMRAELLRQLVVERKEKLEWRTYAMKGFALAEGALDPPERRLRVRGPDNGEGKLK